MQQAQHGRIVSFIWRIAADVLRDVFVRGKCRDVILPMTVIRRLDSLLIESKDDVRAHSNGRANGIVDPDGLLRAAAGQPFYNTSAFTLKSLLGSPNQVRANFLDYLDGFSHRRCLSAPGNTGRTATRAMRSR